MLFATALGAVQFHGVALGEDARSENGSMPLTTQARGTNGRRSRPITITTQVLGMTGWQPDPVITITTRALGMTGWQRDPITITTRALGMTGWQPDPIIITAQTLGMTGSQREPITITTQAFGMTGWASLPEQCSAPFVRDGAGGGCVCPPGLLPSGEACIAAGVSPPSDISVEIEGPDACEAGKKCPFDILVVNVGTGPFHGPMVVRDEVNLSGAQVSTTSSGWSCAASTCVRPGLTLAPGESERLTVDVLVPAGARRGFQLRQCAELKVPDPADAPVRFVQLMLTAAGIDVGPVDNLMGQKTSDGIEMFRGTVGLPSGFDIDEPLIAALRGLMFVDPRPENDRNCTEARVTK